MMHLKDGRTRQINLFVLQYPYDSGILIYNCHDFVTFMHLIQLGVNYHERRLKTFPKDGKLNTIKMI